MTPATPSHCVPVLRPDAVCVYSSSVVMFWVSVVSVLRPIVVRPHSHAECLCKTMQPGIYNNDHESRKPVESRREMDDVLDRGKKMPVRRCAFSLQNEGELSYAK